MQNPPAQELQPEEAQVIRLILHAIREIRYRVGANRHPRFEGGANR